MGGHITASDGVCPGPVLTPLAPPSRLRVNRGGVWPVGVAAADVELLDARGGRGLLVLSTWEKIMIKYYTRPCVP